MICANIAEARFLETLSEDIPVRLEIVIYSANIPFSMERFEAYVRDMNHKLTNAVRSIPGFRDQEPRRVLMHLQVLGEVLYERRMRS